MLFLALLAPLSFSAPQDADPPRTRPRTLTDRWDLGLRTLGVGYTYVDWGEETKFEGGKGVLDASYAFDRELGEPSGSGRQKETLKGIFDANLEIGESDVGIQYGRVSLTAWAQQVTRPEEEAKKIERVRDQLELGSFIAAWDDTLGLEYYYELRALRVGRWWSYRLSDDSPFTLTGSVLISGGWVWAQSENRAYDSMSNLSTSLNPILYLEHERWGMLYTDYMVGGGFDIGEPHGTYSREALVRGGYRVLLTKRTALDIFFEKRSFHVDDFDQADLYTKTRRYGFELVIDLL